MSQADRETQTVPRVRTQAEVSAQLSHRGAVTFCMGVTAKNSFEKEFDGDLCYLALLKASWVLCG